jgi:hypothetical protein
LAEIQREIIKKGKRNVVSRLVHAKHDKEVIATWKSDLGRILHIFNVRVVVSVRLLFTVRSQTELAINTHVTVSDIRHDVAATHTIVSGVQHEVGTTHSIISNVRDDVASTHIMVSDIHHIIAADGDNRTVSITCTPFITE